MNVDMAVRMVALDIDGTLTPAGRRTVPEPTVRAVAGAAAIGHHIVLATGRSLVGVLPIARALDLDDGWAVASNGAVTVHLDPGARGGYVVVEARTLDVEPVVRLACRLMPGVQVGVEDVGWGYLVTRLFGTDEVNGAQRLTGAVAELWATRSPRVILAGRGAADTLLEPIRALGVTANPDGPDWIDVTPTGVSKATALDAVRRRLKVAPSHTVAVGDGINDLPMLAWAARAVAMGQAPPAVREAAHETTGSIDEGGVVAVLRSLTHQTEPPSSPGLALADVAGAAALVTVMGPDLEVAEVRVVATPVGDDPLDHADPVPVWAIGLQITTPQQESAQDLAAILKLEHQDGDQEGPDWSGTPFPAVTTRPLHVDLIVADEAPGGTIALNQVSTFLDLLAAIDEAEVAVVLVRLHAGPDGDEAEIYTADAEGAKTLTAELVGIKLRPRVVVHARSADLPDPHPFPDPQRSPAL